MAITKPNWTLYHLWLFLITFFSYALFHTTRKTFSNVKSVISQEWLPQNSSLPDGRISFEYDLWESHRLFVNPEDAESFLGDLDACFLFAYAVGLYISGILGDRFDPRKVLSVGMILSSGLVIIFGFVSEQIHFYNKGFYVALWLLSGLIQSTGWPTLVALMSKWFGKGSRGSVVGLWSANASIGNIIGSYLVSYFLPFGYEYAFLVTGSLLGCGGIIVWFSLVNGPEELGLPVPDQPLQSKEDASKHETPERPKAISVFRAILLPGVITYSVTYMCIKFVNYSFFYWIPFYLNNEFGISEEEADQLSTWYDWGGIAGGFVGGICADLLKVGAPVPVAMLLVAIGTLAGYAKSPKNHIINATVLAIAGFFIGGPANLISGALCADIGRQSELQGNIEAAATVAGIMDGTGSVGAAIGQLLVPFMDIRAGWISVFVMFMILCLMACLLLTPLTIREVRSIVNRYRHKSVQPSTDTEKYERLAGSSWSTASDTSIKM